MRRPLLLSLLLLAGACSESADSGDDMSDTGSSGRPAADTGNRQDTEPADSGGAGSDGSSTPDAGSDAPSRPDTSLPDTGEPTGDCTATTLDGAIACQAEANDEFVDGFCDCFTETAYEGDRAACVADQPDASAFTPDACVRAALLGDEPAAVTNSLCYATSVRALAACVAVCPPTEADFNACFDVLGAAFDRCDAALPAALVTSLAACDDAPIEVPEDVAAAVEQLSNRRDDYVSQYCGCYGATEFGGAAMCRTELESRWDPGFSACEQAAFNANSVAALPFVACLGESFVIAESSCIDCPSPADFEYELCSDLSIDIQFCFNEAAPDLQDALVACAL